MYSMCPVCGISRSKRTHAKCSRKLQAKYAPGTEAYQIQEEERQAEKASRVVWTDIPQGKKAAYNMKVGTEK